MAASEALARPVPHTGVRVPEVRTTDRFAEAAEPLHRPREAALSGRSGLSALITNRMRQLFFPITGVHRDDLEGEGYDTSKVDDSTMRRLASKMADAYLEASFWIDLPIIADELGIPKRAAK